MTVRKGGAGRGVGEKWVGIGIRGWQDSFGELAPVLERQKLEVVKMAAPEEYS